MTPDLFSDATIELDWLRRWSQYAPHSVAIQCADTGKSFTYRQCFEISQSVAARLAERFGLVRGDRVAVLATNEIEYVLLFFALQRLGTIMVPVNFRLTPREVSHILEDSECRLLVHQESYSGLVRELSGAARPPQTLCFTGPGGLGDLIADSEGGLKDFAWRGEFADPCMILYTSGTTGAPKGAVITNRMLFWNSVNTSIRLDLTSQDRAVIFLPFFHTSGWNVLTTPFLHRGASLVFLKKFDPERVLEICESEKVTILFGVPTTMEMMARTERFAKCDLQSVRFAIVGGEPMTVRAIETWAEKGIPIRQGFGLTEFGPNVFSLNAEDAIRKIGSIGFPNFYVDARIVDDHGRDLGAGEIGELFLRGPTCMAGYWRNAEATDQTIKDGWLATGDLVRRDEEGYYYVVGRKKEMYISGGENVYPAEVEKVIHAMGGIKEVAVIGVPDERWGETGKAFVALEPGAAHTEARILEHCLANLAKYKVPKSVVFLPELPKGDSGKILKRQLR